MCKIEFKLTQGDAAGEGQLYGRGVEGRLVGLSGSKCGFVKKSFDFAINHTQD